MIDHMASSVFLIFGLVFILSLIDESYLDRFNTKTAYRNSVLRELNDPGLRNCSLIHMNTILRHGTRLPSGKDVVEIKRIFVKLNRSRGRSNLTPELRAWRTPFSIIANKQLSLVGYQEMTELGARYRKRYKSIMGAKMNKRHIQAYSTTVSRAKLSGRTFLRSFLEGIVSPVKACDFITYRDDLLRFFDNCPLYSKNVVHNDSSYYEYRQFLHGPEMTSVVQDIKKRWGIEDVSLTTDDVRALYTMCGFEIATNLSSDTKPTSCLMKEGLVRCPHPDGGQSTEISPLCSLFNQDHFAVIEYLYDLKQYSIKAYGNAMNWIISCKLMYPIFSQILDVVTHHKDARSQSNSNDKSLEYFLSLKTYPRAVFWFAHAETILPVITLLGLFNQTLPMTAKEFQTRLAMENVLTYLYSIFRTANIVPFSGNVGLDLYHCPRLSDGKTSGYRIQVKVNEKAVAWPAAGGSSHMSVEDFLIKFKMCDPQYYNFGKECQVSSKF